jgi:cupin fold WbuC family metalloprotein
VKIFDKSYFDSLTRQAAANSRLRQHLNIHESYEDPCQRMVNALEPNSYIPPHRHFSVRRNELMVALRGKMALVLFDEHGVVMEVLKLGCDIAGSESAACVELVPETWHTVVALESGCILLEIKAGPFDPSQPKDIASWAPEEGTPQARTYLQKLTTAIKGSISV